MKLAGRGGTPPLFDMRTQPCVWARLRRTAVCSGFTRTTVLFVLLGAIIGDFFLLLICKEKVSSAYYDRGVAAYTQGNIKQAIRDYSWAIRLNSRYALAYHARGIAYGRKQMFDRAIADLNSALWLKPDFTECYYDRGFAYYLSGRFDWAIGDYNRVIAYNVAYFPAYYGRGRAYQQKGDFDKAISDYTLALGFKPDSDEVYWDRGHSHYCRGDCHQAINDFKQAVQLNPTNREACNSYAWILATCPDGLLRDGKKAVEMAERNRAFGKRKTWFGLGTLAAAYAEMGDFAQAINYQKQVLKMNDLPNDERAEAQQRLELYENRKPYRDNKCRPEAPNHEGVSPKY